MRSNASRTSEVRSGGIYLDVSVWESSRAERFTYTHAHALNSEGTRQRGRDACSDACTYYGARQYLNTLDGKVVHEGEIGIPLCSGVRRVRARGWTGRLLGERGGREGGRRVDLHTRHEPLSQRDGTDWKPFIHSVALYFFPVFDWESIVDHPSSPLSSSTLSLSRSVPTGTLNYYFSPFSFFLSSLFLQPFKSSNSGCR